ncbi:MAG: hypothetical protein GX748_19590 [Lentisphaerae bacterium]|nr:hypothetical protein [Lentisphaerota bacterium]
MRKAVILAALMPLFAIAQDAEFVLVKEGGIHPAGAVATLEDISQAAVQALVVAQSAATVSNAAAEVQAMVDSVGEVINSVEGVGYIRGYLLDFGVSEAEVNTNVTANIIRYDHAVSNDVTSSYCDVYVYFSEEPAELPVLQWAGSPRTDATWQTLPSVATVLTTITVDAVEWECYRITVALPIELRECFIRVFGQAQMVVVGSYLPVRNGIKVGNFEPLTAEVICGTNTIKFVGGVRVQ